MKILCITLLVTMMVASHALVVIDKCERLCHFRSTPGICGVCVDVLPHQRPHHRYFQNYCDLRKHNCRHPHNRYQAEIDLAHCPGHVINGPYVPTVDTP